MSEPVHIPIYHTLNKQSLIAWRKEVISARQNWLFNIKNENNQESIRFYKVEASDCLKHERACTQIIEYIDGKRAGLGNLQGDKYGFLQYRIPTELESAFRFCLGLARAY